MTSTDYGKSTRFGVRTINSSPAIPASGPSPGTPTTAVGEYSRISLAMPAYEQPVVSRAPIHTLPVISTAPTKTYKMCGMDHNTNGLYDTWTVSGSPDFSGTFYAGSLTTPLRNIFVAG